MNKLLPEAYPPHAEKHGASSQTQLCKNISSTSALVPSANVHYPKHSILVKLNINRQGSYSLQGVMAT